MFEDLFRELKDEGFKVTVKESNTRKLDFSKSDVIDIHMMNMQEEPGAPLQSIKTIDVKIEKRVIEDGHLTLKSFNIDEIKETLRFAESYVRGQEDLNIEYIYTMRIPKYLYYNSVDALPDNQEVDSVTVAFTK